MGLTEDDVFIVPNIPLISGIPNVKSMGFLAEFGFRTILASTQPEQFQNLTISKYMFGYRDKFMSLVEKFKWDFKSEDVGILAPRRGLAKKSVSIFSGIDNVRNTGRLYAIDNKTKVNIWKSDECNEISGSAGVIYGPSLVQNKQEFSVYLPDICRTLPLVFDRETTVVNGMRSYRYVAPSGTFSSPTSNHSNKDYCELKSIDHPHTDGILEVSDCIDGSPPIIFSHPHFMEGDAKLFEHFEGLQPNKSLHESYAYIHPRLSVPLFGVSRMMLSLKLSHFGSYYEKVPEGIILPLAWIETTTEDFPDYIKAQLFLSTVVVDYFETFMKYGSLVMLLMSSWYLVVSNVCGLIGVMKLWRKMAQTLF